MFLTEEQVEKRLNSEKNLARATFITRQESRVTPEVTETQVQITEKSIPLPGKNRINLTKDERTEIAIETRSGSVSQVEAARAHGVEVLTVQNIHKGKTKGIDENKVEEVLDSVRDRALNRLMQSLGLLTDDKLSGCSAKDLSVIASNMGRVVEKITPKTETPDNINFIIYSPELKQERAYERVEI
jgi:hypothetical protein